jgi:hypothetical protein
MVKKMFFENFLRIVDFVYDPSQFEDTDVIDPEKLKSTIGSHYIGNVTV